jgi:crotonobetainyl-CoA:carnitine CoA-transferase CaiB-like acyl-CoA transferase
VHTSLLANGVWAASCVAQAKLVGADFSSWRSTTRIALTRPVYRTADGRWLQFTMVRTPDEIRGLLEVAGLGALLDDPRFASPEARLENALELIERLRDALAARSIDEWMARFAVARVPASRMGTLDDLLDDAQLDANSMTRTADLPGHPAARLVNHPVNVSGLPTRAVLPAPDLGQHTDEILRALGYAQHEIDSLRAQGIV